MNRTLLTFLLVLTFAPFLSAQWLTGWNSRQKVYVTETSGNNLVNHQLETFKPLLVRIEDSEIAKLAEISQNG